MAYGKSPALFAGSCALLLAIIATAGGSMIVLPGKSYRGALPPLQREELLLSERLQQHVGFLAGTVGERNMAHYRSLVRASDYVRAELGKAGLSVSEQSYSVDGKVVANLEGEVKGTTAPQEIVVIGAHYDSAPGTPGANDNASGVAALIELARRSAGLHPARTLRFVAFVNEEAPFFHGEEMGSVVYARRSKERREKIVAMVSLETIGYYSDQPESQLYPAPLGRFYPDTGNFIGFVSNWSSQSLLRKAIGSFRGSTRFPSEGVAAPALIPGIGWSDQWAFWQQGYPALMVTDTALYRYPHYHQPTDTYEKIDYDRLARVVPGLGKVVEELAGK
ncbi:hypothetical protein GEOBRER4_n0055 [Citrifermentans bremense]|uniref:Peptidase M28 domain-containing protein n=1 Tax=Citrifermentans bremense TaxID=60035 RepID=A0A6S6LTR4_9BACT|nr:M28 family peptidase [Citrifermentans bremense]BCG45302.1 hypothetical protein GEOBRER4_n0055 [Citrifermentans bremense]